MSDQYMRRQSVEQAPYSVDSTNSSIDDNNLNNSPLTFTPDQGSTIISNGNNFLTETLHSYIDALKFEDALNQSETRITKDSSVLVAELQGRKKDSNANKGGTSGNNVNSNKAKSKVTFSSAKSSSAYMDPKSQQQIGSRGKGDKKSKSSTTTVIREWGKRPLLVESEAPWTPRNRMYQNAIKAIARGRQMALNSGGGPNLVPRVLVEAGPSTRYVENNGNQSMFLPSNSVPQVLPFLRVPPSAIGQQQPFVTGISPLPVDFNNRPLTVAIDPSTGYPYQSMVPPSPHSIVYGQLNSQGVWVPLTEHSPLQSRPPQR